MRLLGSGASPGFGRERCAMSKHAWLRPAAKSLRLVLNGLSTPGLPRPNDGCRRSIEMRTGALRHKRKGTVLQRKGFGKIMGNMAMPIATELIATTGSKNEKEVDCTECSGWRFRVGQCISHKDQSMPSLVLSRVLSGRGAEIYGVRSFATVDPNRDKTMLGECLVDVVPGTGPCHDCLLFNTGMCPGQ